MNANRVVFVTGAATGIGRAIAKAFDALGDRVAVFDRDLEGAQKLAADLDDRIAVYRVDVTDRKSVEAAFTQAAKDIGPPDVVCANAGVSSMQRALDLTDADWDFNMDVNAKGVFITNQVGLTLMRAAGLAGCIINTASLAAKVGAPLLAHYSASKFAVLGWTQALAKEMAPDGIRVNAVCPGFVRTGMQDREVAWEAELRGMTPAQVRDEYVSLTPMGRLEDPEDVAGVVIFLASDAARFMTGQGVNVTGGVRMD
jgi:NAD(P)-dependent dehydrogenase (short-subunit alcohol dehydrogenase family)